MKTQALIVTAVHSVHVGTIELPEPGPADVLVRTLYSGISPGTELRKMSGVEGDAFPYIPGYTQTGIVEWVGDSITDLTSGTRVWCGGTQKANVSRLWGGHTGYALRGRHGIVPLPDTVAMEEASIAKLAAIAYHGLRLAKPAPHETVAVIGLGPIGQCAARVYAAAGATVVAVDLSEERVGIADAVDGVTARVSTAGIAATVKSILSEGADIVVDCTGSNPVIPQAIACARDLAWNSLGACGARFVVQGSYPDSLTIPYDAIFRRELQVLVPRDHLLADLNTVLDLMARGRLSLRELISDIREPVEAQETYDTLRTSKGGFLTAAFRWS
jgi:2-desacetyl-2-hydroxyethyl bacteriochlorophyllide A dehydrogenase